jgi:hypothetical protein
MDLTPLSELLASERDKMSGQKHAQFGRMLLGGLGLPAAVAITSL